MSTDPDAVSRPADTMRERVGETRVKIWFLISANRWLVTGVIRASTYTTPRLSRLRPDDSTAVRDDGERLPLFSSIIIATVTSVTLVLSMSQFVLAGEIGPLGQQRERMTNETEFREEVEDAAGIGVSPVAPSRFLRTLIETAETRAITLNDAVTSATRVRHSSKRSPRSRTASSNTARRSATTCETQISARSKTLLPVLNYNYSWNIFTARTLRDKYDESLSTEAAAAAFDDLIDALRFFGPAREHFKTLYVQWEIINISREQSSTARCRRWRSRAT